MSATEHEDMTPDVTVSSGDVYTTPIALGFEDTTAVVPCNNDIKDGEGVRGRCGLYNLGNTCFMNAGLQCLMSTSTMVKFLLNYTYTSQSLDSSLLGQFQRLFYKIWSGKFSVVHPKDFKTTLGVYHPQFQDYRQHDCQEFLALLLDTLHEQLNFKCKSSNQNTDVKCSTSKQPIRYEHNINNKVSPEHMNRSKEMDDNAVSSHSSLTFDNMKEKNTESTSVKTNSGTNMLKVADCGADRLEKCQTAQNVIPFTINQISEDSNHSSVSEQSSDSDQCSVMKNLKLRSSPTVPQSSLNLGLKITNDCAGKDSGVSSSFNLNSDVELMDETSGCDGFKRVHSLQDFRQKCEADGGMGKSSSELDLTSQVNDVDGESDKFEALCKSKSGGIDIIDCDSEAGVGGVGQGADNEGVSSTCVEPVLLNNAVTTTGVPLLQDLYSKETKTLNTNVLAEEFMSESVTKNSEKFAKPDNTGEVTETEDILLQNVHEETIKPGGFETKPIKDVNIRADKKSKSPKSSASGSSMMNVEKEDCFALSSVKRMKFEGTEKNLQMQEICKIQKEALLREALSVNAEGGKSNMFQKEVSPSVESDVESDTVEDVDVAVEMDVSDDEEPGTSSRQPRDIMYTESELQAAEQAWQQYHSKNDSIIVDTFQGQFKSTVVCAECNQVSVTFEPFMYLSVPIPRAMERQLCVTFISREYEATNYLVILHKLDKIAKLKSALCQVIGRDIPDLIVAEVFNWHVSRILEDNTMLRYINSSSRQLYAFEMDQAYVGVVDDDDNGINPKVETSAADSQTTTTLNTSRQGDSYNDVDSYKASSTVGSVVNDDGQSRVETTSYYEQDDQFGYISASDDLDIIGTRMWEWGGDEGCKRRNSLETEPGESWLSADSTTNEPFACRIAENIAKVIGDQEVEVNVDSEATAAVSSSSAVEVGSDWKSCAICLEELPETDLLVHTTCEGTFCSTCLDMSVQHYSESSFCCPVCSTPADITEDFVPLTNAANHKPKTRIVAIPIVYRCEKSQIVERPYLFAHPTILNLPSNLTGQHIYSCIQHIKPNLTGFKILLTDGTGLKCSRCLFTDHCRGCEIAPDGEAILRPGDHLTVSMVTITKEQVIQGQLVTNHKSMEKQTSNDPLTLLDCFSAFTQSEELDEHNPWFCPHCKQNQRAKKTMTVWQYPDTLIIQLKRFVFHELSSTKVDNKVIFPIENLDLNNFITGPTNRDLVYNLYSLVCHFGGANSGHYTSYAKHPVERNWYYYNDETVSESTPGDAEFSSTYVLFYQRKGTDQPLYIPDNIELYTDTEPTDQCSSSSLSHIHYTPPDEQITFNNQSSESQPTPSTSSDTLVPSVGVCDLFIDNDITGTDTNYDGNYEVTQTDSINQVKQTDALNATNSIQADDENDITQTDATSSDSVGKGVKGTSTGLFSYSRTEIAEADSTDRSLDFYS